MFNLVGWLDRRAIRREIKESADAALGSKLTNGGISIEVLTR